jgi:predicted enzyme related to lactoylglutathione lyase
MTIEALFPPGVPCWVETLHPDARAAADFYAGVFGWEIAGPGPMPDGGAYYVARVDGKDVAGIGSQPRGAAHPAAWTTYVLADDVNASVERVRRAGGSVIAPPFDAPPAGRGAVVTGPGGEVFGVWEAGTRGGAQLVNAPGAWAMSMLRTQDLDRAVAFYETVFGWQPHAFAAGETNVTLSRLPGYVGGVEAQPVPRDVVAAIVPKDDATLAAWSVDFWIADTDAAVERAKRLGGSVVVPPFDDAPFRRAVLADPDGATFMISQLTPYA